METILKCLIIFFRISPILLLISLILMIFIFRILQNTEKVEYSDIDKLVLLIKQKNDKTNRS